jgi:hypothetical protein
MCVILCVTARVRQGGFTEWVLAFMIVFGKRQAELEASAG